MKWFQLKLFLLGSVLLCVACQSDESTMEGGEEGVQENITLIWHLIIQNAMR